MPPLSDPLTIRLPEEIVAWLDGKVKNKAYKNRSAGIVDVLEKRRSADVESEPEAEGGEAGSVPPWKRSSWLPYFIVPLRQLPARKEDPNCLEFQHDRMMAPAAYVPLGIWTDDPRASNFMVDDFLMCGSQDLFGCRQLPLALATESSYRNGLPTRLTIDPGDLHSPDLITCIAPNIVTLNLHRIVEPVKQDERYNKLATLLAKRVMLWSMPDIPDLTGLDAEAKAVAQTLQSGKNETEFRTLGSLLSYGDGLGVDLNRLFGFGDPKKPEIERIGILAVAPEYQEAAVKRLQMSASGHAPGPYGI